MVDSNKGRMSIVGWLYIGEGVLEFSGVVHKMSVCVFEVTGNSTIEDLSSLSFSYKSPSNLVLLIVSVRNGFSHV